MDYEKQSAELKKQLAAAQQQIAQQQLIIKALQNQIFGKKTEVFKQVVSGQQSLFSDQQLTELEDSDQETMEVITVKQKQVVRHRKAKRSGKRTALLNCLPQVDQVIPLTDTKCPYCQEEMSKIGQRLARREATLKPAELYCKNYYQESYKCNHCHPDGNDLVINSKVPQAILPHSYFSSSILAKISELKFNLALPFHRQLKLWLAMGMPVNDTIITKNIIKVSESYLMPLYKKLCELIRSEEVIHMDETPFQVLEEHKANCYFWATKTTAEFSRHPINVFHYANTRSGKVIKDIVGSNYQGIIMCDGYSGYSNHLYPNAKFGSCLVHIRREFINIIKALHNRPAKSSIAQQAVSLLRPLFHMEKHLKYHTKEEKAAERRKRLKPLLDSFYDYISQVKRPLGKLRNAIQNAIALKLRVYRIFENGQVPLTNNPVEQAIRPSTLIRKNSLFAKSIRGAQASAVYYTIVGTAKMNHLNIYKYFKYLFDHLPNRENKDIEGFLPWAKEVQAQCHI